MSSDDGPDHYGTWLEPYVIYHTRYLALRCYEQHDTPFFATCCSPLWAGESLDIRPAYCNPATSSSSSASRSTLSSSLPSPTSSMASASLTALSRTSSTTFTTTSTSSSITSSASPPSSSSFPAAAPTIASDNAAQSGTSRLLSIILPSVLIPLVLLALCCLCCQKRRRDRRASWTGWDDAGSSPTVPEGRFRGVPILSYLHRSSRTTAPSSRPPSYSYRRASATSSTHAGVGVYGQLGRGLAVEREEQVRRESRGLLAHDGGMGGGVEEEDEADASPRSMRSAPILGSDTQTSSSSSDTFSFAADSLAAHDDVEDGALDPPLTPGVVNIARLSQRGAQRSSPRFIHAPEFGDPQSPPTQPAAAAARFLGRDAGRRGSTTTASSRETAFYSAPSTPVVTFAEPVVARDGGGVTSSRDARPGVGQGPATVHAPNVRAEETVQLLPRQNAFSLTSAFRSSTASSGRRSSAAALSEGDSRQGGEGEGLLREGRGGVAASQRVRIIDPDWLDRCRRSNRASVQQQPNRYLHAPSDDYNLRGGHVAPALEEYDLGSGGEHRQ